MNYETIEPWPLVEHSDGVTFDPNEHYKVRKTIFGRPTAEQKAVGKKWDKSKIIYNAHVTLSEIPLEAYDYLVNGKSAIEWIMDRYQVTRDKESGIINDPNDWSIEHNQPRYIIDLLKRIVRISMETLRIVRELPALNEKSGVSGRGTIVEQVLTAAEALVDEKRREGWTQPDFARALGQLFKSESGDAE